MRKLLTGGRVFLNNQLQAQDILIENDRILAIGQHLNEKYGAADELIAVAGNLITPGFVDVHVHLREPGFTDKETVKTGTAAAAHGGYTTIGAMPNVDPVPDTSDRLQAMQALNHRDGAVHVEQYASITKKRTTTELVDFKALKAAGAFAFSNDGAGVQSAATMYAAMQGAQAVDLPLVAHIEDSGLAAGGVMNAGVVADRLGLPGISGVSESAQLARDLELAAATGVHYHACHISTAASVRLIRAAKAQGVHVTAEVSPHHLLLDESLITRDNPQLKMNPPLRTLADRQALLAGLMDGTLDMIATDHAPHTAAEKSGSMLTAAFGITGLETAFAMLYTKLVRTKICSLTQLLNWLSTNPAKAFHLTRAGRLQIGGPADLTIINLQQPYQISAAQMLSKGKNSPFIGERVYGNVLMTMVAGQLAYGKETVQ